MHLAWGILCLFTCAASALGQNIKTEKVSLNDVLGREFQPQQFNGTWLSDNEITYRSALGAINVLNVETGQISEILPAQLAIQLYTFSPDRKYLLYLFDHKFLYRYSNFARYSIIDLSNGAIYPIEPLAGKDDLPQSKLSIVTWNTQGHDLFYVYENNIYYRPTPESESDIRITSSGADNSVFNGVADWVYEEEILYSDRAIWCSGDGKRMVFATFNDSLVDEFHFSLYGEPGELKNQYPTLQKLRYPKPGRNNPTVTLWSIEIDQLQKKPLSPFFWKIPVPGPLAISDHYFSSVVWANDVEVSVTWFNRHQNTSYLQICNVVTTTCETVLTQTEPRGWVDMNSPPKFSSTGRELLMITPVSQGDHGDYKHLVHHNRDAASTWPLTEGRFEMTQILAWDQAHNTAYAVGTSEGKPGVRHLYRIKTDFHKSVSCLTCKMVNREGKACNYNSITLSKNNRYFVHACEGPNLPRISIVETETGKEVYSLNENDELKVRLSQRAMPRIVNMQVPIGDSYLAQVRMFLPPSFGTNNTEKYPLVVHAYGGPGFQLVSDRFSVDFGTYLVSSHNVIYALIDGRGCGYQGSRLMQEIYRHLGTAEVEDQISVTRFLTQSSPFIDKNRIAIWGHSYGGYVAASVLARDTEGIFKCGVSVAPVTNWIYYDSVYAERYMGFPTADDNAAAYKHGDLSSLANQFRGKKFYLVHGTADDNVHYQQSLMLAKSLEMADVLFRQQSYTDENHNIARLRRHHYHSMTDFFINDCFELDQNVRR